jgi:hypothetical protein
VDKIRQNNQKAERGEQCVQRKVNSYRRITTINDKMCSRDPSGQVGQKKGDAAGNILGPAKSQRVGIDNGLIQICSKSFANGIIHFRPNLTGTNSIHPDSFPSEFHG